MSAFNIPIFDFSGHLGNINAVCYTGNDQVIYAVEDQSIRIWDINKKKTIHILHSINQNTQFLCLSSDDKYLVAADPQGFIELWDLATISRKSRIHAYSATLHSVIFAENENTIITVGQSDDYLMKKFKIDKNENLKFVDEFDMEEDVKCIVIEEKNKSIIALADNEFLTFKFKNFKISNEIDHDDVTVIYPSEDRQSLLGLDETGMLKIWQIKKFKLLQEIQLPQQDFSDGIKHIKYLSAKKLLIFGDLYKIRLWDVETNTLIKEIKSPKSKGIVDTFNCLAIDDINEKIIVGGSEKLRIIELLTGKNIQTTRRKPVSPPFYGNYRHTQLTADHKFLIAIRKLIDKKATKELIEVWNIAKNEIIHKIIPEMDQNNKITALAISSNSKFFVTGDDSKISSGIIWNLKTGKVRKKLKELDYGVNAILVSNDNSLIITSDATFDIEKFDAKTGKYLKKISSSTKHVSSFALSQDNNTLVCAFRDIMDREFDIIIWDIETGKLIKQISANIEWQDKIINVEYSSDEKEIIARSLFGYWIRWDTKSWKLKNIHEALTERLTERLDDEEYVYPFAENIILHISDTLSSQIMDFLKNWLQKPTWISRSDDTFSLISELDKTETEQLKVQIEEIISTTE